MTTLKMLYTNLSQFRDWVKNNQGDIALVVGFILISIIAFGAGRLTAPPTIRNPIVVESEQSSGEKTDLTGNTAAISDSLPIQQTNASSGVPASNLSSSKGIFVGSKNSNLYHWPWCAPAKNIKPENQVWFQSEAEARAAGRKPSSCVATQAPAGYKSQ